MVKKWFYVNNTEVEKLVQYGSAPSPGLDIVFTKQRVNYRSKMSSHNMNEVGDFLGKRSLAQFNPRCKAGDSTHDGIVSNSNHLENKLS